MTKTFCVGFNKTGTVSRHDVFTSAGLRSYHGIYSDLVNAGELNDPLFDDFDCFSDGERHDVRALDDYFPEAKFILNTRRLDDWLLSRIKHVHYRKSRGRTGPLREEYERDDDAVKRWIERRRIYHDDVRAHFSARPHDFLEVNVCDDDNDHVASQLIDFLDLDPRRSPVLTSSNSHHENVRSGLRHRMLRLARGERTVVYDIESYRSEVDRAFTELGLSAADRASAY